MLPFTCSKLPASWSLLLLVSLCAACASLPAADYSRGMDALNRGDYAAALVELEPLAKAGDARAQNSLAYMYRNGLGVSKDEARAALWRQRAVRGMVGQPVQRKEAPRPPPAATGGRIAGTGSGFIVDRRGSVLTNHHVIDGCRAVRGRSGRYSSMARVLGTDPGSDLALLRLDEPFDRSPALFRPSMSAVLGEDVLIAGFPLHGLLSPEVHVGIGIVSALAGPRGDRRLMQISTPVQPGSSGGPVLDAGGRVIGVVAGVLRPREASQAGALWPAGISFAVRPERVESFLRQAGVRVERSKTSSRDAAVRAAAAQGFTLLIECFK